MLMLVRNPRQQERKLTVDSPDVPVSKGTIKKDSRKALKQLKTLGELIHSNSEFRKLLADANILFRDIFADAAHQTAETRGHDPFALTIREEGERNRKLIWW
jgi:hypothetical protein